MIDKFYRRSIAMLREEKGIWNQIYRLLIQFREEAISRVFRFLRNINDATASGIKAIVALLDDKRKEIEKTIQAQFRLLAEKEAKFLGKTIESKTRNHPRKITTVRDKPLFSGEGNWFDQVFIPVKKKLSKSLKLEVSKKSSIETVIDRIFGKDTKREVKVGSWQGNEFQGGVLSRLRSNLKTLVTTGFYEMVSKVRKFSYARADKVSVLKSVAVLDGRTTNICRHYHGLSFEAASKRGIGHQKKFLATPRHWNCRSQHLPDDFDGKKIEQLEFDSWFKDLSNSAQDSLLGSRGGEIYRGGQNDLLSILKRLSPSYLG